MNDDSESGHNSGMTQYVDPRTTPASEYPVENPHREKLSEEEVYSRLDNVREGDLIEVVIWQRKATKVRLLVIEHREDDLLVQTKHGKCRLPKAETYNGSMIGLPSLHRDEDQLGLVEYVLEEGDFPRDRDPSQAANGYNL